MYKLREMKYDVCYVIHVVYFIYFCITVKKPNMVVIEVQLGLPP